MRYTPSLLLLLSVSLGCFSSPLPAADVWTGASWVWDELGATSGEPRYFRHAFELKAKPKSAQVQITADNHYELRINGKKVGADGSWNSVETYDVAKLLAAGENVIAVQANNAGGPAGLLARLVVQFSGKEKTLVLGTGSKWKTSRNAGEDWAKAEFDDQGWKTAVVLGGAAASPWHIVGRSSGGGGPSDTNVSSSKIKSYRPASEEIEHFILPEGFEIELVAAEPLVINPVCVTLDEQGRMYVSESHTYRYGPGRSPVEEPTNPIVRLDPLPDGKGYKRVLVAEGFDDPVMGMAIRGGQLWCTANNYLFTFELTEEGPAKNKQTLLVDKNKAWNPFGMFVLEWGPEGDLYLSVGNHNIDIGPPEQKDASQASKPALGQGRASNRVTGRGNSGIVLRMKPDGTRLERLVHGLRVPYSYDYDPFGQLWLLSNGQGNPNRFVRVIEGVDYHCYSRGAVGNEWLAGRHPLAPPCLELPRGACTQLLRYYGSAFPKEYVGSLFLDNWGAHGFAAANRTIHRYVPDERNNIVAKEDFLVCRDPHFRCSHVLYAPDGNLLIADWYGRDDESDLTGRIWKVSYTGEDKPEVKHTLDSPQWKDWQYALSALGSPDHQVRGKAIDEIVANYGDSLAWPLIAKAVAGDDPLGAAGALWALVRIGTPKAMGTIYGGTRNPDWRVRRLALRLMRRYEVENRDPFARELLQDDDPAVRLEAALTLTDDEERRSALIDVLRSDAAADEHLRYEAAWHLADVADKRAYVELLSSEDEVVRLAGLIAIDVAGYEDRASKAAAMDVLAQFLVRPQLVDTRLLLELARLHRSPALVDALRELVRSDEVAPAVTAAALLVLRSISPRETEGLDRESVRRFLDAVQSGTVPIRSSDEVMTLLELLEDDGPSEFALAEIGRRIGEKDRRIRDAAIRLAIKFRDDAAPLGEVFWSRILDPRFKAKPQDKLDYLGALLSVEAKPRAENWRRLLQEGEPLVITDAVRSFRQFGEDPNMVKLLGQRAPQLVKRHPHLKEDLAAVTASWKSSAAALSELALPELPENDAAYASSATAEDVKNASAALGRRVFERAGCIKCHTTVTENTERAPSLKDIGKGQKLQYLVESVLEPSKVIKTGFETETVITTGGKIYSGLVKEEGEALRIITADDEIKISKNEVDERSVQKKSLMPEGQHRTLSRREFADLVAYLQSLK